MSRFASPFTTLVFFTTLLFAGCTEPGAIDASADDGDARPVSEPAKKDPEAPLPQAPATVDPPAWAPGDWWRWRIQADDHDFEVTTGVTQLTGTAAVVGLVAEGQSALTPWFHLPPMGDVDMETLGYEAHDAPMRLLDFPLVDGKSWDGEVEGTPVVFRVNGTEASGAIRIEGHYESGRLAVALSYLAEAQTVERIALHYGRDTPWASATLLEWGHLIPDALHVPSLDDVYLGGAWTGRPADAAAFDIGPRVTHILVGCQTGGDAGQASATLRSPSGETTSCPGNGPSLTGGRTTSVHAVPASPGTWILTTQAAGRAHVSVEAAAMTLVEASGEN